MSLLSPVDFQKRLAHLTSTIPVKLAVVCFTLACDARLSATSLHQIADALNVRGMPNSHSIGMRP
jgi:hypothetical protein